MNYLPFSLIIFLIGHGCYTSTPTREYIVGETSWAYGEYSFIDLKGDTIRKLDPLKYTMSFTDTFERFAVLGIKGKPGWYGVDIRENVLFEIYNTSGGEISPDYLVEDKIRIVDEYGKIGFANSRGNIIIKPQFEIATPFKNGYAIIGKNCKKVFMIADGETEHTDHEGCQHYFTECAEHGYIDSKGRIIKIGNYTFEEIRNEINSMSSD